MQKRDRFDYLSYFLSKEDRPFGRTTGANHTTAAGVGYEEVMAAFITPDPCHTVLGDAALQTCSELVELKE